MQSRSNIQHHTWVRAGAPSASASFPVLQTGLDPGLIGGIKDLLYNTLVNLHTGKKKDFYKVEISSHEAANVLLAKTI